MTCLATIVFAEDPVVLESNESIPYSYMEDGVPSGHAYDIANSVFKRAGVAYEFSIKPWARVYKNALNTKNYFIPALGRTPKREKLFHWIGPVMKEVDINFYKLKVNPIEINNIEDAKKYVTGVERGTYYQDYLDVHVTANNRELIGSPDQLLKMLVEKRVDYIILEDEAISRTSIKLGIDPDLFEKSLYFFSAQSYLAASLTTEKVLIDKLKNSYAELKRENLISMH